LNLVIKKFQDISEEQWDSFVHRNSRGWFFYTSSLIKAKSTWNNHENISIAVFDDQEIVSVCPLYLIRNMIIKIFPCYTIEALGGWLVANNDSEEIESFLVDYLRGLLSNYPNVELRINFSTASLHYPVSPVFKNGFRGEVSYISVINLNKDYSMSYRKGHKSEIKKAEKKGLTFREATQDDLEAYYSMHLEVCARSSIMAHPKSYFAFIFGEILQKKLCYIGCALMNDVPIAIINYAVFKNFAAYWTGACFDAAYQVGANHFLHNCMLKKIKEAGVDRIDMGEILPHHASLKIQGLSNFKSGFGGEIVPCFKGRVENYSVFYKAYKIIRKL